METLKKEKGADWVRVPFRGGGEAVNAIMSGTTPIALFGEGNVIGNVRAGQMTPLVMMNNIRSPNFPDVPLLSETGYNGPPSRSWYGIFAPAGTPREAVARLNKEVNALLQQAEIRDALAKQGMTPVIDRPERLGELVTQEIARWNRVVASAGLQE
jgi:tripartite-type tricarboxylate transporter receptor subunit TctC